MYENMLAPKFVYGTNITQFSKVFSLYCIGA